MRKIFRANLYFLMILLISTFVPYLLGIIYENINLTDSRIILFLNHVILFLVPAAIYILVTKASVKKTFRLNPISFKNILWIMILAFAIQPVVMLFSLISGFFFSNDVGAFIGSIMDTPYPILLLLIAVMPAITEEVTLRGIVLSGYDFKNKWVASIVTGLLFGVFHLNAQQFLYAAILGMVLAYLVRITNSIFASVVMHFMINGLQVTLQKVISLFMENNVSPDAISQFSMSEKMAALSVWGFLGVIFAAISIIIIKKIEDDCKSRGIYDSYERLGTNSRHSYMRVDLDSNSVTEVTSDILSTKERVLNGPLIATIIIYFIVMNLPTLVLAFNRLVNFRR